MREMRLSLAVLFAVLVGMWPPAFASGGGAGSGGEDGAKKDDKKSERKITTSEAWVTVDPMVVTVFKQSRIKGMLVVEFGLDIPDEKMRHHAEGYLPRLQDQWLRTLSDFAMTKVKIGRQANLDALTERLQKTTEKMLGGPGAKVLLLQVMVRER